VLNDHARILSSFDCDGDWGAEWDDGMGRSAGPAGLVAFITWSGVDSGILLVAAQTHPQRRLPAVHNRVVVNLLGAEFAAVSKLSTE